VATVVGTGSAVAVTVTVVVVGAGDTVKEKKLLQSSIRSTRVSGGNLVPVTALAQLFWLQLAA